MENAKTMAYKEVLPFSDVSAKSVLKDIVGLYEANGGKSLLVSTVENGDKRYEVTIHDLNEGIGAVEQLRVMELDAAKSKETIAQLFENCMCKSEQMESLIYGIKAIINACALNRTCLTVEMREALNELSNIFNFDSEMNKAIERVTA